VTKIYEALENARKGRKGLETPEIPSSHPPIISSSHPPILPSSPMLDMEEGMINLHQSIESILPEPKRRIIQFIGSREGEGTSTIIREFARVSAIKFGKSVLLLDADRNHPSQRLFFNIKPEVGWEDVMQDDGPIDKALYQIGETRLFISPVSQHSASTPPMIDSLQMDTFLKRLRQRFDLILIDSPPATTSSDGLAISSKVDGIVLVVEAEKTRWPVTENVKERITKSGGNILGIVLNKRKYYIPEFIYKRL
jgi:capsular exopolysaccharide synthesis family protein